MWQAATINEYDDDKAWPKYESDSEDEDEEEENGVSGWVDSDRLGVAGGAPRADELSCCWWRRTMVIIGAGVESPSAPAAAAAAATTTQFNSVRVSRRVPLPQSVPAIQPIYTSTGLHIVRWLLVRMHGFRHFYLST